MAHVTAVIVGDADEAVDAASKRYLHVVAVSQDFDARPPRTVLTFDEDAIPHLAFWMAEPPMAPPFPVGTCLIYSIHKNG